MEPGKTRRDAFLAERPVHGFNEVRAVEPGKTLPLAARGGAVQRFNEVRAVEPGKTRRHAHGGGLG